MTNENSAYTDDFWKSSEFPWKRIPYIMEEEELLDALSPRPSSTKPGLVAYYQTPEKRAKGILTPIKPGRFLRKYFSEYLFNSRRTCEVEKAIKEMAQNNDQRK